MAALVVACLALAGCFFGDDDDESATPTPIPSPTVGASPTPSPTPDPLSTPPGSIDEARGWLAKALGPSNYDPPCPERLKQVRVACAQGDADGDGISELAYLVPARLPGSQNPFPSVVLVRVGKTQSLESFETDLTEDSSPIGMSFFGMVDRTGDSKADLTYLRNLCGSTGCRTQAVVQTWDGTAWRDVGPGGVGIANVDSIVWKGSGGASTFEIHGGKLPPTAPREAGPTRAATTTFEHGETRFQVASVKSDPPEYLYHAFLDAEEVFARDKRASIEAFKKLPAMDTLLDWKARPDQLDRRPSLKGFALFRIALALAALQQDEAAIMAALDTVILESREDLFVRAADEFRQGFRENGGLIGGCARVNVYLARPFAGADTKKYVEQLFDYGYANDPGSSWLVRICPF